MRVAINCVKQGRADACVSAGNTGALMAISRYVLKTVDGIDRPAIASLLPNQTGGATTMLDLGAGSGILALAARALGARSALGLDYDPDAVRTARANARVNGLSRTTFRQADAQDWSPAGRHWEVIAANVFANLLTTLLPRLAVALAPGGDLFLSGVLADQAEGIAAVAGHAGLRVEQSCARGPWRALWCVHAEHRS